MQVSKHIHAIRIPFRLEVSPGKTLDRFVYVYLIYGRQVFLVDSGVSGSKDTIFNYIKETGRDPNETKVMVITHAHPDHIGGALGIQNSVGCNIAAHVNDIPWIEDIELQYKERPIPSFHSLVKGSVKVNLPLKDGDSLELDDGSSLRVIHTLGHSKGHISLFYEADRALISGDSIPVPGEVPIYESVLPAVRSAKKLRKIKGLEILLSSWAEPCYGNRVYKMIDEGISYFQRIHREVLKENASLRSYNVEAIATRVCKNLGLPQAALNPLFFKSIEAHLKAIDCEDLLTA